MQSYGLMRYNNGNFAIVDDIPLLSQWIKKFDKSNDLSVYGADYEARTRYLHLGKVALYQMS